MYTPYTTHAEYFLIIDTELFWGHKFSKYRVMYLLIAFALSALQVIT